MQHFNYLFLAIMYNKLIVIWLFLHIDEKLFERYYMSVVSTTQRKQQVHMQVKNIGG